MSIGPVRISARPEDCKCVDSSLSSPGTSVGDPERKYGFPIKDLGNDKKGVDESWVLNSSKDLSSVLRDPAPRKATPLANDRPMKSCSRLHGFHWVK